VSAFFPLESAGGADVDDLYGSDWEPAITFDRIDSAAQAGGGTLGATVPLAVTVYNFSYASIPDEVLHVSLDGGATEWAQFPVPPDPDPYPSAVMTVEVPVDTLPLGVYTATVWLTVDGYPNQQSESADIVFAVTDRVAGPDRFATAVAIAQEWDATHEAGTVYVTTGFNYPDALSAGPAAIRGDGPVLLVTKTGIPGTVMSELVALDPDRVVVLGDENSIDDAVVDALVAEFGADHVDRIAGATRYATSLAIARDAWSDGSGGVVGSGTVFVSDGRNFPDALSAGAAAGSLDAPVLLVDGGRDALPAETLALIAEFGASSVVVTGSPDSVSSAIEAQLGALPGVSVLRLGGESRYATSALIATEFFPTADHAWVATGANYPDALAGAALAGAVPEPLLVAPQNQMNYEAKEYFSAAGVSTVTLLGGEPSLSSCTAGFAGICGQ